MDKAELTEQQKQNDEEHKKEVDVRIRCLKSWSHYLISSSPSPTPSLCTSIHNRRKRNVT